MLIRKNHEPVTSRGLRRALSYSRVSDKEQEQGYSILAQQKLFPPYAADKGMAVEQDFVDVESAKKPGRRGFTAMLKYLQKNPGCRVILVEKTDRLYRNLADAATVEALGVEVHLVKENQVLSKASRSVDKYRHGLDVLNAKRYIDNLSEEVQKGLRTKAGHGLWPSFAPLGYRNITADDGKKIIVPDPVLGPAVTNLFQAYATGEYSLQQLAGKAYEEGLRFRKSNGRVPAATVHKILRNRIYMGAFDYGGMRYQGNYEPLVTREVWDQVQEILDGRRQKKHRKVTHEFAFSGLVCCGHCGCSLVGELKKGRYIYYHCTGYRGNCGERYTREETLQREFAKGLAELSFPQEILEWLEAELVEAEKNAQAVGEQALRRHRMELERLQQRQGMMYDDRLDGRIDAATYDNRMAQIQLQQAQIQEQIRAAKVVMPPPADPVVALRELMNRAGEWFSEQTPAEQRRLLHVVVQGATWKNGELQLSLREPFESLRRTHQPPEPPGAVQGLPMTAPSNLVQIRPDERGQQEDSVELSGSSMTAEPAAFVQDKQANG